LGSINTKQSFLIVKSSGVVFLFYQSKLGLQLHLNHPACTSATLFDSAPVAASASRAAHVSASAAHSAPAAARAAHVSARAAHVSASAARAAHVSAAHSARGDAATQISNSGLAVFHTSVMVLQFFTAHSYPAGQALYFRNHSDTVFIL
jgi:hypothetical protein